MTDRYTAAKCYIICCAAVCNVICFGESMHNVIICRVAAWNGVDMYSIICCGAAVCGVVYTRSVAVSTAAV